MLGWALIINNVGRRRYPLHWWAPGPTFVYDPEEDGAAALRELEDAEVERELREEGDLVSENEATGIQQGRGSA